MSNRWKWFIIAMLICFLATYVITCLRHEPAINNTQQLLERIDSLNLEVERLRTQNTQLVSEIDSSEHEVQVIETWHEIERNIVLTQSTDSDIVFFRRYISSVTE